MSKNNTNTKDKGDLIMSNTRRIRASEVEESRFYKMPKWLIHDERFKGLSNDARVLYMIMRDRHELSLSNKWIDGEGFVYMIYTRESMCADLGVSIKPVIKAVKELLSFNLIDEVRQGCNKPNLLYVLTIDLDSQWKCHIDISKHGDIPYPNMEICQPNETNINKTYIKDTENLSNAQTIQEPKSETLKAREDDQLSINLYLVKDNLPNLYEYLSKAQKDMINTWDYDRLVVAVGNNSKSFDHLKKCYDTPFNNNTPTKEKTFTKMYSHNWDLEALEDNATNHTDKATGLIDYDNMSDRAKALLDRSRK